MTDFLLEFRLARLFINTVDSAGLSRGADDLNAGQRQDYKAMCEFRHHLRGSTRPSGGVYGAVSLTYLGHRLCQRKLDFHLQAVTCEEAEICLRVGSDRVVDQTLWLVLGSTLIMEGIAFEMELLYLEQCQADIDLHAAPVPSFPYRVIRPVVEGISGRQISREALIKVAILSLQSTDPGAALIELANRLADVSVSVDDVVAQCAAISRDALTNALDHALTDTLTKGLQEFANRRGIEEAVQHLQDNCISYLRGRLADPFFELELPVPRSDGKHLVEFMSRFPPCAIQHVGLEPEEINELFYLSERQVDMSLVASIGAYQALVQFMQAHIGAELLPTTRARKEPCMFSGSCAVPFAISHRDLCQTEPWKSFVPGAKEACWYAAGVAVARGRSPE